MQIESASSLKKKCLETQDVLNSIFGTTDVPLSTEENTKGIVIESIDELDTERVKDEVIDDSQPTSPERPVEFRRKQPRATTNKNKKPELHDYRCFICDQMFDLISSKDFHVKQDHPDARVCKICQKKKLTPISLEAHLRFHSTGYRFLCSGCGKSFRFKNLLDSHFNVEHSEAVKYRCDLCIYETKFKINLERHVKSVHMKLKNFKCEHCSNTEYSTQVGLNLHLYRVHNYTAPVNCAACLQGFTFESELRVHKKHCTGIPMKAMKARPQDAQVDILENGFKCRICGQVFNTRGKWSVHFHHKHKNTNICSICQKQMASSTSLMKHIQVQHQHIKKFQCDICMKTFGFKHSLESHKNTHTGEKPFACDVCHFRSGDRSTISKHKKKIHGRK